MRVQTSAAREKESHRHHRGIHRRPADGERNEARKGAGNERFCCPIKDLGEAGPSLGCHITWDHDAGTLKLDQHCDVRVVDSKFKVEKTSTTPAAEEAKPLSKDNAPQTEAETEEMRVTPFREAVGALVWAATMTRPDVVYAAHQL